jgi:DNA-binding NarL/FixJ family response regulator
LTPPTSKNRKNGKSPIRVLIADDFEVIGQAFQLVLENAGMEVVGVFTTGEEAIEAANSLKPDVVLLDIVMPEMDGLAALAILKYLLPEIHVFMLTSHSEKVYMARALELGAKGFFSKGVAPDELVDAILAVLSEDEIPENEMEHETPQPPSVPGFTVLLPETNDNTDLTDQEKLILTLLSMGYSSESITDQLVVSHNTLKTHLRNIYKKLGVSDRTQAVIWAIRNGLTPIG